MSTIWKNGKYQPLIRYVTNKDFKLLSNLVNIINGDSNTKGSFRKTIKDLIGGAPEAYDTLKEIADKLKNNDNLYTAISNTIATKATTVALNEEITRAKAAEASITSDAKLSKKANSTALNDYVLTTVLNEQVNTLNAAIDAKQPKGNYLTEHSKSMPRRVRLLNRLLLRLTLQLSQHLKPSILKLILRQKPNKIILNDIQKW